jgi:hypothetical protein
MAAEALGRSPASISDDLRAAAAFSEDQFRVIESCGLTRSQVQRIARLPEGEPRAKAIDHLAAGVSFDDSVAAGAPAAREGARAKARPPRKPTDVEMSDADWLAILCVPLRDQLQDKSAFDCAALLYRRDCEQRHEHRKLVRDHLKEAYDQGYDPLSRLMHKYLWVEHPRDWSICEACLGRNAAGEKCDLCSGAGFTLRSQERKK